MRVGRAELRVQARRGHTLRAHLPGARLVRERERDRADARAARLPLLRGLHAQIPERQRLPPAAYAYFSYSYCMNSVNCTVYEYICIFIYTVHSNKVSCN